MATIKKNNKKLVTILVVFAVIIVGSITSAVVVKAHKNIPEVKLNTVSTETIVDTVDATGQIGSGLKREYKPASVATVEKVYVKVGDNVKKGDRLADFDTSQLDIQVASLENSYISSKNAYDAAVRNQKDATEKLKVVNKKIAKQEKIVSKLQKKTTNTTKATTKKTTQPSTSVTSSTTEKPQVSQEESTSSTETTKPTTTYPHSKNDGHTHTYTVFKSPTDTSHIAVCSLCGYEEKKSHAFNYQKVNMASHIGTCTKCGFEKTEAHTYNANGYCTRCNAATPTAEDATKAIAETLASIQAAIEKLGDSSGQITILLTELKEMLSDLSDDLIPMASNVSDVSQTLNIVLATVLEKVNNGEYDTDRIADAVGDAVTAAIKKGMIEFIDSGAAVQMIESAVKSVNWAAIGKGIASSDNFTLTAAQIQLATLYAQKEVFYFASYSGAVGGLKQAAMSSKNAYDLVKNSRDTLKAGWLADFDGVITSCEIVQGGQTTALATGMTLENMEKRVVTISLGEYAVHKVKLGMKATVKTAYGNYDGYVATIAPTATGGTSGSVLDSVGAMAGVSGLSSLTAAGAGVETTIIVDQPDENIIVGFDASVQIVTSTYNDVPCVPIESIVLEKQGAFVYLYDEEEGTVTKTPITTGATSSKSYQVLNGVEVGQKIIATPQTPYDQDTFKVRVIEK